jgi:excisionase family DNA binding protein
MPAIQSEPVVKTITLNRRPLTLSQATEYLQTSKRIVQTMVESGQLPGIKLGARWRVWSDELEAFGRNGQAVVAATLAKQQVEHATRFA